LAGRSASLAVLVTNSVANSAIVTLVWTGNTGALLTSLTTTTKLFVALNGGPQFKFDEAISFQISCQTQKEVDYFWSKLTAGGGQEGPCGWLKDRFGLSWQVVPAPLIEMMLDKDAKKVARVTDAFLKMKKFDIEALKRAYDGKQ